MTSAHRHIRMMKHGLSSFEIEQCKGGLRGLVWYRKKNINTSKCVVLIQSVNNRDADKDKYKSLDLHFIF